jgi:hypothetical protein
MSMAEPSSAVQKSLTSYCKYVGFSAGGLLRAGLLKQLATMNWPNAKTRVRQQSQ